jgi:hypothetical protein
LVGDRVSLRAKPDFVIAYLSEDDIEPMVRIAAEAVRF